MLPEININNNMKYKNIVRRKIVTDIFWGIYWSVDSDSLLVPLKSGVYAQELPQGLQGVVDGDTLRVEDPRQQHNDRPGSKPSVALGHAENAARTVGVPWGLQKLQSISKTQT